MIWCDLISPIFNCLDLLRISSKEKLASSPSVTLTHLGSCWAPAKVDEALGIKFIPTELLVWVQNQRSTPVSLRKTKGTKGMRPPALTRLSREPEPTVQSALTLEYNSIRVDVMFRLTTSSASKWTARRLPRELKKERLKCKQTATK